GLVELGALHLVAGVAHVGLIRDGQHGVVFGVDLVACRAGHVVAAVRTALPGNARLVLVAAQADFVLLLGGNGRLHAEGANGRLLLSLGDLLGVMSARSVAGLAL